MWNKKKSAKPSLREVVKGKNYSWKDLQGFTLLELMIVLAILSILISAAYSGYQHTLQKSRRLDAQASLLDYHTRMQHCFVATHNYTECAVELQLITEQLSAEQFYNILLVSFANNHYTLQASAIGHQQQDKDCVRFTINQVQERLAYQENGEQSTICW